jgi:hypothetical protein
MRAILHVDLEAFFINLAQEMASKLKKTMERVGSEFLFDIRTREVDEMIQQRMEERTL